ncbi:hypothetical protein CFIMG_005016RAa [Ceratocystis fimbriata CBS 114723]|uniref:DUF8035 domain-containing protein n=1 Tax=Ceratocystis fimbriata CBS 114723 TaxID=1035309 RepID=A0A2C5WZY2_9PEZI|nr:hypothetical protein CFIMG_005016RAa [Ceratocystis fimbriata CBS 114723]
MSTARFPEDIYLSDDEPYRRRTAFDDGFLPSPQLSPFWLHQAGRRADHQQIVVYPQEGKDVYSRRPHVSCISTQPNIYYDEEQERAHGLQHGRVPVRNYEYPRRSVSHTAPRQPYTDLGEFHLAHRFSEEGSDCTLSDSDNFTDQGEVGSEIDFSHTQRSSSRPVSEFAPRPRSLSRSARDEANRRRSMSRPASEPEQQPSIKVPTIEREVIIHFTRIDHGIIDARPKTQIRIHSPPPLQPVSQSRPHSRHRDSAQVNIEQIVHRRPIRNQSRSRATENTMALTVPRPQGHRRALSAAPLLSPHDDLRLQQRHEEEHSLSLTIRRPGVPTEATQITTRINENGQIGEASNGITQGWTTIDVPPGTKRVRMDGAGGSSAEVTWHGYKGLRRARFIHDPEQEAEEEVLRRSRPGSRARSGEREGNKRGEQGRERGRERGRRPDITTTSIKPSRRQREESWIEIPKKIVNRAALRAHEYDFEETEAFFYVKAYLGPNEVAELIALTKQIRREKRRIRKLREGKGRHRQDHFAKKGIRYDGGQGVSRYR